MRRSPLLYSASCFRAFTDTAFFFPFVTAVTVSAWYGGRDAQQQLHLITDSMSALVTRCTHDLKYSWVSKPYADWLRRSRDEIIGASIEETIGRAAFDELRPYFQSVLNGQTVRLELEVDFKSIGPRWVNAVYTPTFGADGKPDGWVAVVIDIDAQKREEEVLRVTGQRKDFPCRFGPRAAKFTRSFAHTS